ncbi:MAG TPA: hypothetical protein VK712_03100 [Verrucomicrobiae bacterium]|jgi:hypothetical protein|nr:hypothetical protein [Verrucomicrobiae bacterium]
MSTIEQLDVSGLEAAQTYFPAQVERNMDEEPGDLANRKAAMGQYLAMVGNAFWRSHHAYGAAHIFVAGPGYCLEPKTSSPYNALQQLADGGEQIVPSGKRQFNWAVVIEPSLTSGEAVFEDTETGEIGEYRILGQRSYYDFRQESGVLARLEENLSHFFFPGSDARQRPESAHQHYNVIHLSPASSAVANSSNS